MNRDQISRLAHTEHPLASPLDDDSVRALLARAVGPGTERALDLGCGGAEWLLRALVDHPGLQAEGVDLAEPALAHAAAEASRLGVADRLVLHQADAAGFTSAHRFDLVLCAGSTHAFGGLLPALEAVRAHLAPGGRVLIGEGIWDRPPSAAAVEMLGTFDDLAGTVDRVVAAGWTPVTGHASTRRELDDYEWSWTGSLASWALDHPGHPDHDQVLEAAATHRTEWLRDYRDCFGFLCLVLRRSAD
jgi:SAM-dependent methyltransferase